MKKSVFLLALLSIVLFTSCNDNDDPVSKETLYSIMNARLIINNDSTIVVCSQTNGQIELDNINMTIKFSSSYIDQDGVEQLVTTPELKLVPIKDNAYYMEDADHSHPGMVDFGTGMLWYHDINADGDTALFMTTQLLLYAYTNTNITDSVYNTIDHQQSTYMFKLDSRGESCDMSISNFVSDSIVSALQYKGLTTTPTVTGYKIMADSANAESSQGLYKLTDLEIDIDEHCLVFRGDFKCNGMEYNVSGNLFPNAQ